ncbi:diacylglycerol kinase family protein [Bernardetia sp.]|uniref:diacylglycerol kinase family protein n=1 Tax=Bernardetia sp. TaxID=1937974 RepID=UPI0025BE6DC1|nr:diacylglycerol kinase family protein [Bernardetia sp.]
MISYFKKQIRSTKHAFDGLRIMLKDYNAFIHIPSAILATTFSFAFQISSTEWLFILSAIALVWISEILNTALEKLVDLVSPERNETAGQIKDLAAGAVLVAAIYALVVGIIIFGERIFFVLKNMNL